MSEVRAKLEAFTPDSKLPQLKNTLEFLAFIIRAVNSMDDLDSVLKMIMDGAITLVGAHRGFILFQDNLGKLEFRVARGVQSNELSKDNFQVSRTVVNRVIKEGTPILMDNAASQVNSGSVVGFNLLSIMAAPLRVGDKVVGVVYLDNPFERGVFSAQDIELVTTLAEQAAVAIKEASLQNEQTRLKGFLDRYVSPQVAKALLETDDSPVLEGRAAHVTILFADISGFTPIAEKLPPPEVLKLLNEHFSRMVAAIFAHDGTVKQFSGDEIMAIFGAPVHFKDHVIRATKAAIAMQDANHAWQTQRKAQGQPTFGLKIGLHSGTVVVGSVGSSQRMEYAAVGDVVNTASHVMNLASRFGKSTCVLATEKVATAVTSVAKAEKLGKEQIKGRQAPVKVYSLTPLPRFPSFPGG